MLHSNCLTKFLLAPRQILFLIPTEFITDVYERDIPVVSSSIKIGAVCKSKPTGRTYETGLGLSQAHEKLRGKGSGTRVYYTNEYDKKYNIRREADNGDRSSVTKKSYRVANVSQPVDNEDQLARDFQLDIKT